MTSLKTLLAAGSLAIAAAGAPLASQATELITNGSFEAPALASGGYEYFNSTVDGWTYANGPTPPGGGNPDGGAALVSALGGSAWYGSTPPSGYDGNQFVAIQSLGSLSQQFTVSQAEAGHTLTLTWLQGSRPAIGDVGGNQIYDVTIAGIGGLQCWTTSGSNFGLISYTFNVPSAGTYLLEFNGIIEADQTAFIDDVSITAIPEPAAWALMLIGFGGLGMMTRRKTASGGVRV